MSATVLLRMLSPNSYTRSTVPDWHCPRIMIALMENYQQADGTIAVPEVLQDFHATKVIRKD